MKKVLAILAIALLGGCSTNCSPGHGTKVGQVVKVSKEGIFCDTYEAQLIRGGMTDGSGSIGVVPFEFTIVSSADVERVIDAMESRSEVVITYHTELLSSPCRTSSGNNYLTDIQVKAGDK